MDDGCAEAAADSDLELHRSAVQRAITEYISSKFHCEKSAGTVACKDGKIHVYICAEKPNLRNFWSGKWSSSWVITVTGSSASISGTIQVHAHYFEDGNVQMISNKSVPEANLNAGSEEELAAAVVRHVKVSVPEA